MSTNELALSATKAIGIHIIPAATLAIGGFLAWKLWQQQQKIKQNQQALDQLQTQFTAQQDKQKHDSQHSQHSHSQHGVKKATSQPTPAFFKSSSSLEAMNDNTKKNDLFAKLLNENIALREAH